ncbi:hypothetical protein [Pararhizobium qamdonense]|uniref:hypothetical protein n=1 Tax=Pararhizobium qamdonense TaxID=3031126 RepID=UPI0023E235C3|nr:hypothetical protein [Pararhizobium qamdonense]
MDGRELLRRINRALQPEDSADELTEGEVNKFLTEAEREKIEKSLQPTDVLDGGSF